MPLFSSKKLLVVNTFGVMFYISCMVQWLWSSLPYIPGIIRFVDAIQPESPIIPSEPIISGPPPTYLIVIVSILTAFVLGTTVYMMVKLPTAIGKTGKFVTKKTSERILPLVHRPHSTPLPPKKKKLLTARIMVYVKLSICLLPLLIASFVTLIQSELTYGIIMILACFLATASATLLGTQLILAKLLRLDYTKIW